MTNTPFSKKCEILGDIYVWEKDTPEFTSLIDDHDIGMPLAYLIHSGIVTAWTEEGETHIDYAWNDMCDTLGKDMDGEYHSLADLR